MCRAGVANYMVTKSYHCNVVIHSNVTVIQNLTIVNYQMCSYPEYHRKVVENSSIADETCALEGTGICYVVLTNIGTNTLVMVGKAVYMKVP